MRYELAKMNLIKIGMNDGYDLNVWRSRVKYAGIIWWRRVKCNCVGWCLGYVLKYNEYNI